MVFVISEFVIARFYCTLGFSRLMGLLPRGSNAGGSCLSAVLAVS
jgi:hypothetical protein